MESEFNAKWTINQIYQLEGIKGTELASKRRLSGIGTVIGRATIKDTQSGQIMEQGSEPSRRVNWALNRSGADWILTITSSSYNNTNLKPLNTVKFRFKPTQ